VVEHNRIWGAEQIALRLSRLKSSSANVERLFSQPKYIQGQQRTRFSVPTMKNIAQVRIGDFNSICDFYSNDIFDECYWASRGVEIPTKKERETASNLRRTGVLSSIDLNSDTRPSTSSYRGRDEVGPSADALAHPAPESYLSAKASRGLEKFNRYIDTSIVNDDVLDLADITIDESDEEFLSSALKEFRSQENSK